MYRLLLITLSLLVPGIVLAQDGGDGNKAPAAEQPEGLSFQEAAEVAKRTTYAQFAFLQLHSGGKELPARLGYFISTDGILLAVVPQKEPFTVASVAVNANTKAEAKLIARDPATGLTLFSTGLRCRKPLVLAAKVDLTENDVLVEWGVVRNLWQKHVPHSVTGIKKIGKKSVLDIQLDAALQGSFTSQTFFQSDLGGGGTPGIRTDVFLKDGLVQAIRYLEEGASTYLLSADDARRVCDRVLREAKLPTLPNPEPNSLTKEVPPGGNGPPEKVDLLVEHRDTTRDRISAMVLDTQGHVATDFSPLRDMVRARSPQMGLMLDGTLEDIPDSLAVFTLAARIKYRPVEIGLEAPKLTAGEAVFDTRVTPRPNAARSSANIVQLDAALQTYDGRRERLLTIDRRLPSGTPLFNAAGQFIGLCLDTPEVFAQTTFVMPADQVWKVVGKSLGGPVDELRAIQDRGLQVVQTHRFGVFGPFSPVALEKRHRRIPPELLEKISHRVKGAFPELQFALQKEEAAIVAVLEPQHDVRLLESAHYFIQRLIGEQSAALLGDQAETAVDQTLPVSNSPVVELQLVPDNAKAARQRSQGAAFLNKSGDLVTWLPAEFLPGGKEGVGRLQVIPARGQAPIPAEIIRRDEATGITVISAKLRALMPYAWIEQKGGDPRSFYDMFSFDRSSNVGAVVRGPATVEGLELQDVFVPFQHLSASDVLKYDEAYCGGVLSIARGFRTADGLVVCDRASKKMHALPAGLVTRTCEPILAAANRPPMFKLPSNEEITALRSRPLPSGMAWAFRSAINGEVAVSIAIFFDEHGHYVNQMNTKEAEPGIFRDGAFLGRVTDAIKDKGTNTVIGTIKQDTSKNYLSLKSQHAPVAAGDVLISKVSALGTRGQPLEVKVTAVERRSSSSKWESTRVLRLDQELLPGEPLFLGDDVVAIVTELAEDAEGGSVAYPDSEVVQIIDRIRQNSEPSNTWSKSPTTASSKKAAKSSGPEGAWGEVPKRSADRATAPAGPTTPAVESPDSIPASEALDRAIVVVSRSNWEAAQDKYPKLTDAIQPLSQNADSSLFTLMIPLTEEMKSNPDFEPLLRLLKAAHLLRGQPEKQTEKLSQSVSKLLKQYRASSGQEREALRGELLRLTYQQFDERHQKRLDELKTLESRLTSLRSELAKRQELRDEIIRKRVTDLLDEDNLLKWESDSDAKSSSPGGSDANSNRTERRAPPSDSAQSPRSN